MAALLRRGVCAVKRVSANEHGRVHAGLCPSRYATFSHLCRPLDILYKHKIRRKNKPRLEGLSLFQQKALSPGLGPTHCL